MIDSLLIILQLCYGFEIGISITQNLHTRSCRETQFNMAILILCYLGSILLFPLSSFAATDFSVTAGLSTWNQSDWSLTTTTYIPGQYQSRLSLANG